MTDEKQNSEVVYLVVPAILTIGEILKASTLRQIRKMHGPGRAVALLGDDDLGFILRVRIGLAILVAVVIGLAVNEGNHVCILLNRS